jgi:hypothetical protein
MLGNIRMPRCSCCCRDGLSDWRASTRPGPVVLPTGLVQRVLHVPELVALNRIRLGLIEGPHQRQARLLHDPPRGRIDRHRLRDHPLHAELGKALGHAETQRRLARSAQLRPDLWAASGLSRRCPRSARRWKRVTSFCRGPFLKRSRVFGQFRVAPKRPLSAPDLPA